MKKGIMIFAAVLAAALVSGCQATPDKPAVVQKDMQQMIDTATGENSSNKPVENVKTSEKYQTAVASSKGDVEVHVDADIVFPKQDNIPLSKVKKDTFSQELVDNMIGRLIRGNKLYEVSGAATKSFVLARLEDLQKMKDGKEPLALDGSYKDPQAELDRRIAEYQKLLATAPDSHEGNEITTEMKKIETQGDDNVKGIIGCTMIDGKNVYINVNENSLTSEIHFGITDNPNSQAPRFFALDDIGADPYPDLTCKLTKDDAQKKADAFLQGLGIQAMMCVNMQEGFSSDSDSISQKPFSRGFYLKYSRCSNGVPIIMETGGSSEDEYAKPWFPEQMDFIVDDSGIISFDWKSPYTAPETISQDGKIMPLDDIESVFEKMIFTVNDWVNVQGNTGNHLTIDIDKMELGLVRLVSKDNANEGLLVPAWVFYGKKIYKGSAGGILPDEEPQIVINAIDGSVIDVTKGY